jgi:hypothetical protein
VGARSFHARTGGLLLGGFGQHPVASCQHGLPGRLPRLAARRRLETQHPHAARLCRIELDVTGVRVERLQAISDADAAAEGCPCYVCGRTMDGRSEDDCHCFHRKADARDYRDLWESINGDGSWDANPWVWVVEFRRVQP